MKGSKCAFNATSALYRVFVAPPVEHANLQVVHRPVSTLHNTPKPIFTALQRRYYYVPFNDKAKEKSRLPRNGEIRAPLVVVVGDDGKMQDPRPTTTILEELDLNKFTLQVVAEGSRGVPPICRIQDREALKDAEKLRRKNQRKTAMGVKEIELNWAIEKGDLKHRLNKIREFLSKGLRVDIILAAKRKGRRATPAEAAEVLNKILATVKEVEGSREYKPRDGKILQTYKLGLEGKPAKVEKEVTAKESDPTMDLFGDDLEPELDEEEETLQDVSTFSTAPNGKRRPPPSEKVAPAENPSLAALRRAAGMS